MFSKRPKKQRTIQAEIWFAGYYETLADPMPDTGYYHLPSCQTIHGIYNTYKEETTRDFGTPISLSQFKRMWKDSFKKVVIPKVNSSIENFAYDKI